MHRLHRIPIAFTALLFHEFSYANALAPAESAPPTLALILLFAFLGGAMLNLMPCVLPVLSLKVLSLANGSHSKAHARGQATWYTLGVVSSFALIGIVIVAVQSTGKALGWGFQLQEPAFVAFLVWMMTLIGLSLAGFFTMGAGIAGAGSKLSSKGGRAGDFWTGALTCLVASPCVAPLMGAPLAYAFTAPWPLSLAVFMTLGLGVAAPFLLIGFLPGLAGKLPKPGAWMDTLKAVLAYPMFLTAVWLLWVLGRQLGVNAVAVVLIAIVVLAFGLWQYERARWADRVWGKRIGALVILVSLGLSAAAGRMPAAGIPELKPSQLGIATPYTPKDLDRLRAQGRSVLVSVTADWCITCIANEQTVLTRPEFIDLLRSTETVYMKGDWTDGDPVVDAFLKQHGAAGVPLYVLYRGKDDSATTVLPQILTMDGVRAALKARSDARQDVDGKR